jgi:RNA repair, ligase-Pnkp-associating, region of Hen1
LSKFSGKRTSSTQKPRPSAALLLEIDPIGLVRNRRGPSGEAYALDQYVNDRPYAASSFLSVALARTFDTAMPARSELLGWDEIPQAEENKQNNC